MRSTKDRAPQSAGSGKNHYRPNFNGPVAGAGNSLRDLRRFVTALRLNQVIPAELFFRFREWSVRRYALSIAYSNGFRCRGRLQGIAPFDDAGMLLAECAVFFKLGRIESIGKAAFVLVDQK